MLKLRLQRRGKRNYATYRVVVAEHTAPVKGRFIADVGHYNPHTDTFKVNTEAVTEWLGKGAQASPTVHNLLVQHSVIKADKVTSWRPKKKEAADGEAAETKDGDTTVSPPSVGGDEEGVESTEKKEEPKAEAPAEVTPASDTEEKKEEAKEETPSAEDKKEEK